MPTQYLKDLYVLSTNTSGQHLIDEAMYYTHQWGCIEVNTRADRLGNSILYYEIIILFIFRLNGGDWLIREQIITNHEE